MDHRTLRVAKIAPKTTSEGPGERTAIWVQGCTTYCPRCCNPEMQPLLGGTRMTIEEVLDQVPCDVEGISLLGGEPFLQATQIAKLAHAARARGLGVVTFTGEEYEELRTDGGGTSELLAETDLLIDGPYIESLASTRRRYIGSDNQKLHYLTDRYVGHPDLLETHRQSIHVSWTDGQLTVTGWPDLVKRLFGA